MNSKRVWNVWMPIVLVLELASPLTMGFVAAGNGSSKVTTAADSSYCALISDAQTSSMPPDDWNWSCAQLSTPVSGLGEGPLAQYNGYGPVPNQAEVAIAARAREMQLWYAHYLASVKPPITAELAMATRAREMQLWYARYIASFRPRDNRR